MTIGPATPVFETSDLYLASFLRCRGFALGGIRRQDDKALFAFADSPGLRRAVLDYSADGPIGARSFSNTLRDLTRLTR